MWLQTDWRERLMASKHRSAAWRNQAGSINAESAAALVHAFVTSRMDYCNVLLAGTSKSAIDKLQRVLNAKARQWHSEVWPSTLPSAAHQLHRLDVPQRVQFKMRATVHQCLQQKAPCYMTECYAACQLQTCSSPASAIRLLPPAACAAPSAFDVRPSGLLCGRPGGLELTTRLCAKS